ncbi:S-layer homology domain-containing protein, partial [Paratissierella segnis]
FGEEVTETAIEIEGYNKVEPIEVAIELGVEGNVINFYYTARTDISYTVNYLEKGTNKVLSPAKTVGNKTFGEEVTETAKTISGYIALDPTSLTIELGEEDNVITFYYKARPYNPPDDDDDNEKRRDRDEVVILDEPVPIGKPELNKEDHFQYIQGYPDNTVRPEGLITREEVAAVFYRLLTENYRESIKTNAHNFVDVKSNRWSNRHIATLSNGEIITGYPNGTFKPGSFITRAELATIASRFDNLSPFEADSFSDIKGHWANKYINSASKKGWVKGYEDGSFKPDQYITRAEFVTLVNAVLERRVHKDNILQDAKKFPDLLESKWYYEDMQEAINSHYYERLEDEFEEWNEIYYPTLDL